MKRMVILSALVLGMVLGVARRGAAQDVTVIVNDAVPVNSLSMDEVGKVFQKARMRWPNGLTLEPVDLAEGAAVRDRFSRMVFSKTTQQVKAWWQTQIFSGSSVPPVELASEQAVIDYVRLHAGAIAYVSSSMNLGEGVRRLRVVR